MTKLSEIGERTYLALGRGGGHKAYTVISDEERCELVRDSVYFFIMSHIKSFEADDDLHVHMETFLKEQGL